LQKFIFSTKEDFIIYLWYILRLAFAEIDRHKTYLDQLKNAIVERDLKVAERKVPAAVFNEFRDKIEYVSMNLCNLLGDHAEKAVSYKKFRQEANKKNVELGLGLLPLDVEIIDLLNELHVNRNWALHIPESLITAEREIREKVLKKAGLVTVLNPIEVGYDLYYEGEFLTSLYEDNKISRNSFTTIFRQMKKDYSALIGSNAEIQWVEHNVRTLDAMLPVELSAQIQLKNYNGIESAQIDALIKQITKELMRE
jgi:hypothetical protein